jgi:hypothetical protein
MDIDFTRFPPWDERGAFNVEELKRHLKNTLTRSNAMAKLQHLPCARCGGIGKFELFDQLSNNAVGIRCTTCRTKHPFAGWGLQWIPIHAGGKRKRPPIKIVVVTNERGRFCYCCGLSPEDLESLGFILTAHHALQYSRYGDTGTEIPVCSRCHEHVSALQRHHRRMLERVNGKSPPCANDIEGGQFCCCCGLTATELVKIGFILQTYDAGEKIPVCSDCHGHATLLRQGQQQTLSHWSEVA